MLAILLSAKITGAPVPLKEQNARTTAVFSFSSVLIVMLPEPSKSTFPDTAPASAMFRGVLSFDAEAALQSIPFCF